MCRKNSAILAVSLLLVVCGFIACREDEKQTRQLRDKKSTSIKMAEKMEDLPKEEIATLPISKTTETLSRTVICPATHVLEKGMCVVKPTMTPVAEVSTPPPPSQPPPSEEKVAEISPPPSQSPPLEGTEETPTVEQQVSCPTGQYIQEGKCEMGACPLGTVRYEEQEACEEVASSLSSCTDGQYLNSVNECVTTSSAQIILPAISTGAWVQESNLSISGISTGQSGDWVIDNQGFVFNWRESSWIDVSGDQKKEDGQTKLSPSQISSGPDGLWSVDQIQTDGAPRNVYRKTVGADTWTPVFDRFNRIADGPHGIFATSESHQAFKKYATTNKWEAYPNTFFKDISDGEYGLWAVDLNNNAMRFNVSGFWETIEGGFYDISSGYYGVWGIKIGANYFDRIFVKGPYNYSRTYGSNSGGGAFVQPANSLYKAIAISSGSYGVWAITNDCRVYFRRNIVKNGNQLSPDCPLVMFGAPCNSIDGSEWFSPDSTACKTQISSGGQGIWGVNSAHKLYWNNNVMYAGGNTPYVSGGGWREGSPPSSKGLVYVESGKTALWSIEYETNQLYRLTSSQQWIEQTPRNFKQIAAGPFGVWALDDDGIPYFRAGRNQSPAAQIQGVWEKPLGDLSFATISNGKFGVWALTAIGDIYLRSGTTAETASVPAGKGLGWTKIDGNLAYIVSSDRGVFGIDGQNRVFFRMGATEASPGAGFWLEMSPPNELKLLAIVPSSDRILGKNDQNKLFSTSASDHEFVDTTGMNSHKEFQTKTLSWKTAGSVPACAEFCSEERYCHGFSYYSWEAPTPDQKDCKLMVEMTGDLVDVAATIVHYRKIRTE